MSDFLRIDNLSELFKLIGLPSPKHPLIAFVNFKKSPLVLNIPEYKVICGFYMVSFKQENSGALKYGRETYDFQNGSLLYMAPEQVVGYGDLSDTTIDKSWTLFIDPALFLHSTLAEKLEEYDFFSYTSNEALHISEKEREIIESITDKIVLELDSNLDEFSEEVILSNIELLLNYSKRFYNRQFLTRKRFSTDTVARFDILLKEYFEKNLQRDHGIPTVKYFADNLNYSPNYLSGLIKKSTDKSILEHIHLELIRLAKIELLNTEKSVSEIAFELGFEYSQYFSRLFKNKTGMSPGEYRAS